MAQIREFRPEALMTFDARGGLTGHLGHVHTHRATVLAAEAATEWFIRRPVTC